MIGDSAEALESQKKILNRLRRANGQLTALVTAIEKGATCREAVIQLSAISSALDKAGYAIIATSLSYCLNDPESAEEQNLTPKEIEKLFLTLA